MKFTLSWLKEHFDTEAPLADIADTLTAIGLEVEEVVDPAAGLGDFVVGHVVGAYRHQNADRLKVCQVDIGAEEPLCIVCGAANARVGLKAVLASPGCIIPATGAVLRASVIRSVQSQGMLCSAYELNLGEDQDGLLELPADAVAGAPVATALTLDPVLHLAVTPNRGDCLGVRGVARDLAAAGLGALKADPYLVATAGAFASPIAVRLSADGAAACPIFAGRFIRGVKNGPSPPWLQERLIAIGLEPVSALVDITNYSTVGWGRPLHVFDGGKLSGDLVVRTAPDDTRFHALNGKCYALDSSVAAVVVDDAGVQAIGGVIGAEATACSDDTVDVFLESAWFKPAPVAAVGRRLGIDTEAKRRFERGVDPMSAEWGIDVGTKLILELCGGEPSEVVIAGTPPAPSPVVPLRPRQVSRLLGVDVLVEQMASLLQALGCEVGRADEALSVIPPSWRLDLREEQDLIEEVARLRGYGTALPAARMSRGVPSSPVAARWHGMRPLARALAACGMDETVSWSFTSASAASVFGGGDEELTIANPIVSDLRVMRPSILPNLIAAVATNAARGHPNAALFEIGPTFYGGLPGEQKVTAAGVRAGRFGPRHWAQEARGVNVYDAKADAQAALAALGVAMAALRVRADAPTYYHPGRSGCLYLGDVAVAWFGELHPQALDDLGLKGVAVGFEVDVDACLSVTAVREVVLPVSDLQPLERDFAFVVGKAVAAGDILSAAKNAARDLMVDMGVFDVYQDDELSAEGRKSIAFYVTLQPTARTLSSEEIDALCQKIIQAVQAETGGVLRA